MLPADGDYVVELADSRYQGVGRPVYRLVIGAVPEADEVFPLGGRQGETVGLELRGGMLNGMQIATATVNPLSGTRIMPARDLGRWAGLGPRARRLVLDLESRATGDFGVSGDTRAGRSRAMAAQGCCARGPQRANRTRLGEKDQFVIATTPGQRAADQGRSGRSSGRHWTAFCRWWGRMRQ